MTGPAGVRSAAEADLDPAAEVLALAFEDYAWTRWVLPEDGYEGRLRAVQRLYLGHALEHGIVLVGVDRRGTVDGVVAALPADAPPPSADVLASVVELHGDRIDRLQPSAALEHDWSIETLGVRPDVRGRGLGGLLVRQVLGAVADHDGGTVHLQTSDERNVRLYERHGFAVVAETAPVDGPPTWTLTRRSAPVVR